MYLLGRVSPCVSLGSRWRAFGAAVVAVLAVNVGCAKEPPKPKEVVRPVKILEMKGGNAKGDVAEFPGVVQAAETARMAFEVPGRIVELSIKEGQLVKKGQVLAKLDARDYQARLASEGAKVREAKVNFQRAEQLYASDTIAMADLDKARAEYGVARAGYAEARKALEEAILRAPFDGKVAQRNFKNFANVRAKQEVVVVVDDSSLEVDFNVPEQDWAKSGIAGLTLEQITAKAKPQVAVSNIPGRTFAGTLKEAANMADSVTRTFKATVRFDPPKDLVIMPGMTAKVILSGVQFSASSGRVPSTAVLSDEKKNAYVWVVDPKSMKVSRKQVKMGPLSGREVIIESGLEGSEWIAISGVHHLREGLQVSRYQREREIGRRK